MEFSEPHKITIPSESCPECRDKCDADGWGRVLLACVARHCAMVQPLRLRGPHVMVVKLHPCSDHYYCCTCGNYGVGSVAAITHHKLCRQPYIRRPDNECCYGSSKHHYGALMCSHCGWDARTLWR